MNSEKVTDAPIGRTDLINNGLNIRIEGTQSYTSAAGAVAVSQSPAAGEMVAPGTVVTVSFRYLNETD